MSQGILNLAFPSLFHLILISMFNLLSFFLSCSLYVSGLTLLALFYVMSYGCLNLVPFYFLTSIPDARSPPFLKSLPVLFLYLFSFSFFHLHV